MWVAVALRPEEAWPVDVSVSAAPDRRPPVDGFGELDRPPPDRVPSTVRTAPRTVRRTWPIVPGTSTDTDIGPTRMVVAGVDVDSAFDEVFGAVTERVAVRVVGVGTGVEA